jgi:hypothetical protein
MAPARGRYRTRVGDAEAAKPDECCRGCSWGAHYAIAGRVVHARVGGDMSLSFAVKHVAPFTFQGSNGALVQGRVLRQHDADSPKSG